MLSRKPRRRRRVRRRPAESSLSQIAEAARATIALAVGCRTAARGLLNARLQSSASRRNGREGNVTPHPMEAARLVPKPAASPAAGMALPKTGRKVRVARKWRRNELKRLNPRPEMVWSREPRSHKIWYTGARLTVRCDEQRGAARELPGNFSSLQALGNKRNRIGIPPAPPCSEDADATAATVSPNRRRRVQSRRRSREIGGGGGCRPRKFSYPQPLEKARNGKGSCDRRSSRRPEPAFRGERCRRRSNCRAAAPRSLPARRRSSPPRRPPAAQRLSSPRRAGSRDRRRARRPPRARRSA